MAGSTYKFVPYEAKDGWRWRLVDSHNGKIVGDSAEAYVSKSNVNRAINSILDAKLVVEPTTV